MNLKYIIPAALVLVAAALAVAVKRNNNPNIKPENQEVVMQNSENTQKIIAFVKDAGAFFIATIDGDRPRVRPFGAMTEINGAPVICTGAWKNVAAQLRANPNVEISATKNGRWLRVSGRLRDISSAETRARMFAESPDLAGLYKGKEDQLLIFRFENATATFEDFAGNREVLEIK